MVSFSSTNATLNEGHEGHYKCSLLNFATKLARTVLFSSTNATLNEGHEGHCKWHQPEELSVSDTIAKQKPFNFFFFLLIYLCFNSLITNWPS